MTTIELDQIEPIYIGSYYDTALSGRCRWNGLDCWYTCTNDDGPFFEYELRVLPDDLRDILDARSAWWETHRSNSWLNPNWCRVRASRVVPQPEPAPPAGRPDMSEFLATPAVGKFYRQIYEIEEES
jgi:hypothetical protein